MEGATGQTDGLGLEWMSFHHRRWASTEALRCPIPLAEPETRTHCQRCHSNPCKCALIRGRAKEMEKKRVQQRNWHCYTERQSVAVFVDSGLSIVCVGGAGICDSDTLIADLSYSS